jgi:hypothetical protein
MDHQLQQLFDFGLKTQGFFGGGHAFISRKRTNMVVRKWGRVGGFQVCEQCR